jgi:hypothetical protein
MHRMALREIYQNCLVEINEIKAVDQVWATDVTYIPLRKGFLYLVAVVDLFSRHVLSWKLSNSLDTGFCLEALEMAPCGRTQAADLSLRPGLSIHLRGICGQAAG